ncbi:MAG: ABC transporter permease [Tyzzerella sp.]|nr:ABC transporter permease [Tyzzerella sp.]
MKKSALRKDFFMEIRKSMGRFLSIFFIVALGVSLFVGIRATEPDMILSGDAYVDENKLMDIKVVSTYGLTEEDADVIERLPAIESVEGAYSVDVLCEAGDNMKVIHVMSCMESMNSITIAEGRLPENENECLVDQDFLENSEYEIGDTIELESGTEDELTDTLKHTSFEIVGSGNSPLYFSIDRGSSTIGNGTVSGFAVVTPEAFDLDVYTEIYAMVKDADEATAFTEEYDVLVEDAIEQIQMIQNVRCEVRKDELASDAQLEIDDARKELNSKKEEAEKEIAENEDKLEDAELELKLGELQIESAKTQLETMKVVLETGRTELESMKQTYNEALTRLKEERAALDKEIKESEARIEELEGEAKEAAQQALEPMKESLAELDKEIATLETDGAAEIADYEKQLADAETQIADTEKEIQKAEKELKSGKNEIESGKAELEDAKEDIETQIADGEAEIDEAEDEIADIEVPVWYVFDRSSIPEYTGYGDNAARIAALAIVFPSIFFLVAALISLTTMTRMVEEQRVQIGTLKALGYSKFAIMKKYLYYALFATLGGSAFGVLVGEKLFPYVIIVAYKVVYTRIPHVILPYQWGVGVIATLIAVLCTGVATVSACYKELVAQPAVLMRPAAPQIGKRTLIEKIPFLWKHLNFTWKSSLRNLFRYKKRFFMTLFGIGGCMGLLMVGFGLRDSITSIATYQYGELQLYDSSVFISEDMEGESRAELTAYLDRNINVVAHMNVNMTSITAQNDENEVDAYLTVIDDLEQVEEFFVYRDRVSEKKFKLSDDGVILTEKASNMLGVDVGDTIYISEEGMNERKVEVTSICENYAGHYVYMTSTLYEELYEETPFYNNLLIKTDEELAFNDLQKIGEKILTYDNILNVQYTASLSGQLNDMLYALDQVMIVLIAVAGMLSFVVLYNLNNINITERRRELATLKVLGFYDGEVATYVYRENILLTLLGTVVGCGVGKFLHLFTITTVEVDMAMFGREIFPISYLYGAAFTIGFSALVNWMMYFKLKKINMVESLKSVE